MLLAKRLSPIHHDYCSLFCIYIFLYEELHKFPAFTLILMYSEIQRVCITPIHAPNLEAIVMLLVIL